MVVARAAPAALPAAVALTPVQADREDKLLTLESDVLHDRLLDTQQPSPYTQLPQAAPSATRVRYEATRIVLRNGVSSLQTGSRPTQRKGQETPIPGSWG